MLMQNSPKAMQWEKSQIDLVFESFVDLAKVLKTFESWSNATTNEPIFDYSKVTPLLTQIANPPAEFVCFYSPSPKVMANNRGPNTTIQKAEDPSVRTINLTETANKGEAYSINPGFKGLARHPLAARPSANPNLDLSSPTHSVSSQTHSSILIKRSTLVNKNKLNIISKMHCESEDCRGGNSGVNIDAGVNREDYVNSLECRNDKAKCKTPKQESEVATLDFAKLMEEALRNNGVTNWQRTESARKREQKKNFMVPGELAGFFPSANNSQKNEAESSSPNAKNNSLKSIFCMGKKSIDSVGNIKQEFSILSLKQESKFAPATRAPIVLRRPMVSRKNSQVSTTKDQNTENQIGINFDQSNKPESTFNPSSNNVEMNKIRFKYGGSASKNQKISNADVGSNRRANETYDSDDDTPDSSKSNSFTGLKMNPLNNSKGINLRQRTTSRFSVVKQTSQEPQQLHLHHAQSNNSAQKLSIRKQPVHKKTLPSPQQKPSLRLVPTHSESTRADDCSPPHVNEGGEDRECRERDEEENGGQRSQSIRLILTLKKRKPAGRTATTNYVSNNHATSLVPEVV